MTLKEFIEDKYTRNFWIEEENLLIYVRKSKRLVDGLYILDFLDLANISVPEEFQNKGIFTHFLSELLKNYPDEHIFVENIFNPVIFHILKKFNFKVYNLPKCMYLLRY